MVAILLENINDLKQQYKNIPENIFNKLMNIDPTYKGNVIPGDYAVWLLNLYNNGLKNNVNNKSYEEMIKKYPDKINPNTNTPIVKGKKLPSITEDDFNYVRELLRKYNIARKEIKTSINQIKSIDELKNVIQLIEDMGIPTDALSYHIFNTIRKAKKKGFKIIFENDMWMVGIPTTKESSIIFGEDTRWCTTQATKEHYENYTKDNGLLYIFYNKLNGCLYQFSTRTLEFRNASNDKFNVIKEIISTDKEINDFCLSMIGGLDYIISLFKNKFQTVEKEGNNIVISDGVWLLEELINSEYGIHIETIKNWIIKGYADFVEYSPNNINYVPECFKKAHLPIDWKAIEYIFDNNYQLYLARFGNTVFRQLTDEEVNEIYDLLNNYYNGKDIKEVIDQCISNAHSTKMLNYIKRILTSIPYVTDINFGDDNDNIVITLPIEKVIEIFWNIISDYSIEMGQILWYLNDCQSLSIEVPDYDSTLFDEVYWNKVSKGFVEKLK